MHENIDVQVWDYNYVKRRAVLDFDKVDEAFMWCGDHLRRRIIPLGDNTVHWYFEIWEVVHFENGFSQVLLHHDQNNPVVTSYHRLTHLASHTNIR